jgi:hypothetical protein
VLWRLGPGGGGYDDGLAVVGVIVENAEPRPAYGSGGGAGDEYPEFAGGGGGYDC